MGECRHTTPQVARPQCMHYKKLSQGVRVQTIPSVASSPFPVTSHSWSPPRVSTSNLLTASVREHRTPVQATQEEGK
ncbi:MAG: hypothetical protein EOO65_06225 [Methanosarcinales archaeon]|nr:MAG: hypothetical protein EOO65_06225 [Methanosarcinales archaeon]